jgi:WD40 repeat protein
LSYDGFISYSHAADDLLAPRLQSGLQRFAKPWWKRRALRVFRDESSLSANPHLWSSIAEALDASGWFVLLLSPDAAQSQWVNEEIAYWVANKDVARILPVVTDGTFEWVDGNVAGSAAPPALDGVLAEEPRWVDLRFAKGEEQLDLQDPRFADAIADVASAMRGVAKDELAGEEVRQHRRTVRTAWAAGGLLVALLVSSVAFGLAAARNADEARRQTEAVEQTAQEADRQRQLAEEAAAAALGAAEAEAAARQQAVESEEAARADRDAAVAASRDSRRSELEALALASDRPFISVLLSLEAFRFAPLSVSGQARLTESLLADRIVARWSLPHLETRVGALHPEAEILALSDIGRGPDDTSTLRVVTPDDEDLWTYALGPAGVGGHDPFFSADGSELLAAVVFTPTYVEGVEATDRPPDLVEGIYVWSATEGGEPVVYPFPCQAPDPGSTLTRIELNPDGRYLPAGEAPLVVWYPVAEDGSCDTKRLAAYRLWRDTGFFELVDSWQQNDWNGQSSISADGRWLLSLAREQSALIDLETGQEIPVPRNSKLSPSGDLLITSSGLLTVPELELVEDFRPTSPIFGATASRPVFGPRSDLFVSAGEEISRLSLATGEEIDRLATGSFSVIDFVSTDGRFVLLRAGLGSTSGEELLLADLGRPTSPAFTYLDLGQGTYWWDGLQAAEGVVVATRTDPNGVGEVVVTLEDGTKVFEAGATGTPQVSPDGRLVAYQEVTDGDVGTLLVVDLQTGQRSPMSGVCPYPVPDGFFPVQQELLDSLELDCEPGSIGGLWVWDLVFSPDSSLLAASDRGPARSLHVWDVASGDLLHSASDWSQEPDAVDAISFHPSGDSIYVTHRRRITALEIGSWEASDVASQNRWIRALAFDGDRLVCAWNLALCESSNAEGPFTYFENGLGQFYWGFVVAPERGIAVLSARNGRVGVWDLGGFDLAAEVVMPEEIGVTGVALTEDGDLLFTPEPGPVLRMPFDQTRLLAAAAAALTRGFTAAECDEFNIENCLTTAEEWQDLLGTNDQ